MHKIEMWQPIGNFPDYAISNHGRIKRLNPWFKRPLRIQPGYLLHPIFNGKYLVVNLFRKGKVKQHHLHSLVAKHFLGEQKKGLCVNHKDFNVFNNHISNLEYLSRADNVRYTVKHHRHAHGIRHPMAKLSEENVRQIRNLIRLGHSNKQIARIFHVGRTAIDGIKNSRTWRHLKD